MGNQTVGCRIEHGICPDGTRCATTADCYHQGYGRYGCRCKVGHAGDGIVCGPDQDLDGWPDYDLRCQEIKCRKVNAQYLSTQKTQQQRQWRTKRSKVSIKFQDLKNKPNHRGV